MSEDRKFYVYILYREDGFTPFYVGMGQGSRWKMHEILARRGENSFRSRIIRKIWRLGLTLTKAKERENLTCAEAQALEVALIASVGRRPRGPLVNVTSGGDSHYDITDDAKRRISDKVKALWSNPAHRENMRVKHLGKSPSAEHREKLSAALRGKPKTAEHAAKSGAAILGKKRTPEQIARLCASRQKTHTTPEFRAKLSAAMRGRVLTAEHRAKLSAAGKARPNNLELMAHAHSFRACSVGATA